MRPTACPYTRPVRDFAAEAQALADSHQTKRAEAAAVAANAHRRPQLRHRRKQSSGNGTGDSGKKRSAANGALREGVFLSVDRRRASRSRPTVPSKYFGENSNAKKLPPSVGLKRRRARRRGLLRRWLLASDLRRQSQPTDKEFYGGRGENRLSESARAFCPENNWK